MRKKITVVGAGNVGATTAQRLAERDYADIVLVDIVEGLPQGKALDLTEAGPVVGYEPQRHRHQRLRGDRRLGRRRDHLGHRPQAGHEPRRPARRRTRRSSARSRSRLVERSPDTIMIMVTNPLDAMCHVAYRRSGLPEGARHRHGRRARLGALPHLPRLGAGRLGARRDRLRAGRPRRPRWCRSSRYTNVGRHPGHRADRRRTGSRRSWSARATAAPRSSSCSRPAAPSTRRRPRWWRWSTRSCSTRSACCRARPARRASTASTACTWACPCKLGAAGVEQIIEIELTEAEQASSSARRTPCASSWECSAYA